MLTPRTHGSSPYKKHRMAVSAAGVYVELIFAAFLVYIWLFLAPGFWKQFTFSAIIAASFTTLLFNANPLMRFDGYYIMIASPEIPNLRQKSRAFLGRQFRKVFFRHLLPRNVDEECARPRLHDLRDLLAPEFRVPAFPDVACLPEAAPAGPLRPQPPGLRPGLPLGHGCYHLAAQQIF